MTLDPGVVYYCRLLRGYGVFNSWREDGCVHYEVYKTGIVARPCPSRGTLKVQAAHLESLNVLHRRGHLIVVESGSKTSGWNTALLEVQDMKPLDQLRQIPACLDKPWSSWVSDQAIRNDKLAFDASLFKKITTP